MALMNHRRRHKRLPPKKPKAMAIASSAIVTIPNRKRAKILRAERRAVEPRELSSKVEAFSPRNVRPGGPLLPLRKPRAYRPLDKGESEHSDLKHALMRSLVSGQVEKFLHLPSAAGLQLVIDMTAGDGRGAHAGERDLFGSRESIPTPLIALEAARQLLVKGTGVYLELYEIDPQRNACLQEILASYPIPPDLHLAICRDHVALASKPFERYEYVLILLDLNGLKSLPMRSRNIAWMHALDAIAEARVGRPLDVIMCLNVGALSRVMGVKDASARPQLTNAALGLVRARPLYEWLHDPAEIAARLHRRFIVASKPVVGAGGMRGRIILGIASSPPRSFHIVLGQPPAAYPGQQPGRTRQKPTPRAA